MKGSNFNIQIGEFSDFPGQWVAQISCDETDDSRTHRNIASPKGGAEAEKVFADLISQSIVQKAFHG